MKNTLVLLIIFFTLSLEAKVTVAFLQLRDSKGNLVQLETGGRFYHVAISFKEQWLQAHPYRGVELVGLDKIKQVGEITEWIELSDVEELDEVKVQSLLGRPFDHNFLWDDETIYCAELVGKLLDLVPTPMYFDPAHWPSKYQQFNGLPGMSPDDIYLELSQRAVKQNLSLLNP